MSDTAATPRRLPYNKACGLEDFSDPELIILLREIYPEEIRSSPSFPAGAEHRKHWEVAMSVRALRDFGVLRREAEILGVGAGAERTIFHLTGHARRVVATDLYLAPGAWTREASPLMLVAPEQLSPVPFERDRLLVQHMDGRCLRFPDDSFDGIFSSGSIEHFGDLEEIAAAAYEMGRVLKPGGVLSLSTELLLQGPPGSIGWPGVVLFSLESLRRHLIEASGLEPVDEPDLAVSGPTLGTCKPLAEMFREIENGRETYPHLVLVHDGQVFGSVHLALRKTDGYPCRDNAWARPSEALRERVRRAEAEAAQRLGGPAALPAPAASAPAAQAADAPSPTPLGETGNDMDPVDRQAELDRRLQRMEAAVAGLQASESRILGALNAMWTLHEKYEAGSASGGDVDLRDRHEILRVRQTRLEGALADLREEVAALRGEGSAPPLPLTPRDMAEILAALEKETHAAPAGAVEISFQDVRAESLLWAARRHFGGRLSSSAPSYRGPNDLWIHVDFTADSNRPLLLENAAARLQEGGRFILITAPAAGHPPAREGLALEESREIPLAAGGPVLALIWRRVGDASS